MGRKPKAPSEYVSSEEMIQRIDKAIRDRRSSPAEILKLQRKRERIMEQIALQQAAQPNDPASEFTAAQQRILNGLAGTDREEWEWVYRTENTRATTARAGFAAATPETPAATAPAITQQPHDFEQFPTAQDPVTQFIQHAAFLREQGLDPAEVISKFDQSHQPQELKHETE